MLFLPPRHDLIISLHVNQPLINFPHAKLIKINPHALGGRRQYHLSSYLSLFLNVLFLAFVGQTMAFQGRQPYLKTLSQKFGYIIKRVTFVYIPGIVMFLGFINTKISK